MIPFDPKTGYIEPCFVYGFPLFHLNKSPYLYSILSDFYAIIRSLLLAISLNGTPKASEILTNSDSEKL